MDPRGNVLGHSDVLCANHFATVRLTRLSRLRRFAYPLASACCGAQEDRKSYGATQLSTTNQAGYSFSSNDFAAVEAVQSSPWKQCKKGAPPKPNVSGFGGERRSSGTTELLPRKAKRRMWSLRRRGAPFSSIFRRAAKDGVPEGRRNSREASKKVCSRVYFSSGSTTPFFSNALCRSIQVPHFPQGFSPPS